MKKINCYIHIPFCTSKCKYCRFASFSGFSDLKIKNYVDFLCKEIENQSGEFELETIYFGGGTPTSLSISDFEKIFDSLRKKFVFSDKIEITVETTPQNLTKEFLEFFEKIGVNRISIGVQTLNQKALQEISRQNKGDILQALNILKNFFDLGHKKISVSLDFIIGLPFVKSGEIRKNLEYLINNFGFIKHFSIYMLEEYYDVPENKFSNFENIVYPNSWKNLGIREEKYLDEYLQIKDFLEKNGFKRYEISNFAKKGHICKHNSGYWKHKENLAFGLDASGFLENIRFTNPDNFLDYYAKRNKFVEKIGKHEKFLEKIMFGLRTNGISKKYLKNLNRQKIDYFLEKGYLLEKNEKIILADKSVLILDYVIEEIV